VLIRIGTAFIRAHSLVDTNTTRTTVWIRAQAHQNMFRGPRNSSIPSTYYEILSYYQIVLENQHFRALHT